MIRPSVLLFRENCNYSGRRHLLARHWPGKKHRRFLRCENRCKNMLISKLNACFCTCFPAVLNSYQLCYLLIGGSAYEPGDS